MKLDINEGRRRATLAQKDVVVLMTSGGWLGGEAEAEERLGEGQAGAGCYGWYGEDKLAGRRRRAGNWILTGRLTSSPGRHDASRLGSPRLHP